MNSRAIASLSRRKKLVAAGLLCGLIASEISLRLGGWIYIHWRMDKPPAPLAGATRILCEGDSFTFGIGAPKGFSYPEQLQRMFDDRLPGGVIVINAGRPGQNSSMILKELPAHIRRYQPNIVIMMAGANDNSNFDESNYYLFMDGWPARLSRVDAELSHLRVYKLFRRVGKTIVRSLAAKSNGFPPITDHSDEDAYKSFDAQSKPRETLSVLAKALAKNPNDPVLLYRAGSLSTYLGNDRQAAVLLRRANQQKPVNLYILYALLTAYQRVGDEQGVNGTLAKMHALDPDNENIGRLYRYGVPSPDSQQLYVRLLSYNLRQAAALCRAEKVGFVFQTYTDQQWADDVIAAREPGTPLIESRGLFSGLDPRRFHAEDGHLNAPGYSLLAKNTYKNLLALFPSRFAAPAQARQ